MSKTTTTTTMTTTTTTTTMTTTTMKKKKKKKNNNNNNNNKNNNNSNNSSSNNKNNNVRDLATTMSALAADTKKFCMICSNHVKRIKPIQPSCQFYSWRCGFHSDDICSNILALFTLSVILSLCH